MGRFHQVEMPKGLAQFFDVLTFLNDQEAYAKLAGDLKETVEKINADIELLTKLGNIERMIEIANERAAEADKKEAEALAAEQAAKSNFETYSKELKERERKLTDKANIDRVTFNRREKEINQRAEEVENDVAETRAKLEAQIADLVKRERSLAEERVKMDERKSRVEKAIEVLGL